MVKKVTNKRVVSKASKVLQDKRTVKDSRSTAGSALSRREKRVSPRVKKGVDVAIELYREALKELEKY